MREPPRWVPWALVAALVAWSAWQRWSFLTSTPYPFGVDGYFYPVQVRSLLETGGLRWPAAPLTFWLAAPLALIWDPITAMKLVAALGGALIAVPAYGLGRRLGGSPAAGLLAAALATASAGSVFLSVEFVKNGLGLTIAVSYLWALARALERPVPGRLAVAALAFVATILTHKMAAGLGLAVTIPAVIVELRARRGLSRRVLIAAAIAVALLIVLGVLAPARFLGARELGLVHGLLGPADWTWPALATGRVHLTFGHEAAIAGALGVVALVLLAVRGRLPALEVRPADHAIAAVLAVLAILVALPWLDVSDAQALPFRLRLAAFVPMALVAASVAGHALAAVAAPTRLAILVPFAAAWVLARPPISREGVVEPGTAMATAAAALVDRVPAGDVVIIPERHLLFMAAWYARVDARLRPESVPPARRWRLLTLAFIKHEQALSRVLHEARSAPGVAPPIGLHPRHPNGLVLLPEATWDWVLAHVPDDARDRLVRWPTI